MKCPGLRESALPKAIVSYHTGLEAEANFVLISQRPLERADALALASAEAVLLPQVCRSDLCALVAACGVAHFPRPAAHLSLDGKVGNRRLFSGLGLPQPDTVEFASLQQAVEAWQGGHPAVRGLGTPLVAKGAGDGMGRNVFLVSGPDQLAGLAGRLETACPRGPQGLVLQRYLPGASEMRVVLLGSGFRAYWHQPALGEFRANLNQGGGWRSDGPAHELEAGLALARRLQDAAGIDIAGVDIIFPAGGGALLLEVNFYFGRQGLGGGEIYMGMYLEAVRAWLVGLGLEPERVGLAQGDL